ncbi:MAG: UDP-N-acetylglucosamine 1-carboxyvinyltransferase [bacterium]
MNSIKIYPSKVKGKVKISGSKNSALPIIVGGLLNKNKTILTNVADIKDIDELLKILDFLGCKIKKKRNKLVIYPFLENKDILHESCKEFRASYYLMGLYLAVFNHVKIYLPGGCNIGKRPIDFHLMGFEALGCKYEIKDNIIEIALIRPTPTIINLPKKSLGATVNLILLASSIEGTTTINNISLEPELLDFINFIKELGVKIIIEGTSLYVTGGKVINKKTKYKIIHDRVEAATFISLGLITSKVKVVNVNKQHLQSYLNPLIKNKASLIINKNSIIAKQSNITSLNVLSAEYPKLSTDIFPVLIPVMAYSTGECRIKETIYENRFEVCNQLEKLGVNVRIQNNECIITGIKDNTNNIAKATDLRCAASLLIYAISMNKEITIENFDIITRGYSVILHKLKKLNIKFKIIK